jgi:TonB-linked SusC/RagA family outer membrane protein
MIFFTNKYIVFSKLLGKTLPPKIALSLFIAITLFHSEAYSQNVPQPRRMVSGQITDVSTGETLVGATVKVQGADNSATVDGTGKFLIAVPNANSVLVVTFTGYTEQQIPLEGKTSLDIKLSRVTQNLDEVVVTGFGLTQRRATVAGAISTVTAEELSHSRAISASGALVGRTPGINFRQTTGKPGQSPDLRIRNFGGGPLIIIDGVTRDASSFNNLDFNDIESISTLKDGSAAIYGMEAANGVIVITTKKGKRGQKPTISLDSYYGTQKVVNFNKPADVKTYIRGIVQTETYGNGLVSSTRSITKEEYDKWMNEADDAHKGFDWYKYIYREAPQYYNKLSVSGGSQNADYYLGIGSLKQKPMFRNFGDGFKRINMQANVNATISKRIKVGVAINGRWDKTSNANIPGDDYDITSEAAFRNLPTRRPYANDNPLYPQNTTGPTGDPTVSYGLVGVDVSGEEKTTRRNLQVTANIEVDIIKGLKARALASYAYTHTQFDSRRLSPTLYSYDPVTKEYSVSFSTQSRNLDHIWTNAENTETNVQLEYKRSFGKHNIQANTGMITRINFQPQLRAQATPPANGIAFIPNIPSTWVTIGDDIGIEQMKQGYIGRLNYDYDGKYIVEFSGRYDGNPGYIEGKQWGFFPGASVAYRISKEDFWQNNSFLDKINDFKLRASYAALGNEQGYNEYIQGYDYGGTGIGTAILNGIDVLGARERGLPGFVTWARTYSLDIGIDVQLLNNRLSGSVDYFDRKSTGLPASRQVNMPNLAGITVGQENLNSNINRGIEGSLNWRDKIGKIGYFVGGNATFSRGITGERFDQVYTSDWDRWRRPNDVEGRWRNATANRGNYRFVAVGQFQSWDEIAKYPIDQDGKGNTTLRPGDFKFQDTNNDGFINDHDRQNVAYQVNGGTPYLNFAFNFGADYKGFDFRVEFAGGSLYTYDQAGFMRLWDDNINVSQYLADNSSWYSDIWDRNSPIQVGKYPLLIRGTPPPNAVLASTGWQTNITYAKVRNIELGYTIPYSIVSRIGISNFKVYVSGQNVLSISNMPSNLDPEIIASGGNSYPNPRILTVGAQVKF